MRHVVRKQHLIHTGVITLAWFAMLILLFDPWMNGYHGVGGSLWGAGAYLSALIAALAFLNHRKTLHIYQSVNAVAPRKYIYLRYFAVDLLSLNIIPFLIASTSITLASTIMAGRGYLVWQYFLLVPLFLTFAILIGWVSAYLFAHIAVGVVFSGLFSLFISFYLIQSAVESDVWTRFDWSAFTQLFAAIVLVAGGILARRRVKQTRIAVPLAWGSLFAVVAYVWLSGYANLQTLPRTADIQPSCAESGPDTVCVWPEDAYKLPTLTQYAARARSLDSALGTKATPALFAEPHIPQVMTNLDRDGYYQGSRRFYQIQPFGAEPSNWAGARGFVFSDFLICDESARQLPEAERTANTFIILDLLTSWIYGDIAYSRYSSESNQNDAQAIGHRLAMLSPDDQLTQLSHITDHFIRTCEVSND